MQSSLGSKKGLFFKVLFFVLVVFACFLAWIVAVPLERDEWDFLKGAIRVSRRVNYARVVTSSMEAATDDLY